MGDRYHFLPLRGEEVEIQRNEAVESYKIPTRENQIQGTWPRFWPLSPPVPHHLALLGPAAFHMGGTEAQKSEMPPPSTQLIHVRSGPKA